MEEKWKGKEERERMTRGGNLQRADEESFRTVIGLEGPTIPLSAKLQPYNRIM